jgi:hypothetical protein
VKNDENLAMPWIMIPLGISSNAEGKDGQTRNAAGRCPETKRLTGAAAAGISNPYLSQLENRQGSIAVADRFAQAQRALRHFLWGGFRNGSFS